MCNMFIKNGFYRQKINVINLLLILSVKSGSVLLNETQTKTVTIHSECHCFINIFYIVNVINFKFGFNFGSSDNHFNRSINAKS